MVRVGSGNNRNSRQSWKLPKLLGNRRCVPQCERCTHSRSCNCSRSPLNSAKYSMDVRARRSCRRREAHATAANGKCFRKSKKLDVQSGSPSAPRAHRITHTSSLRLAMKHCVANAATLLLRCLATGNLLSLGACTRSVLFPLATLVRLRLIPSIISNVTTTKVKFTGILSLRNAQPAV